MGNKNIKTIASSRKGKLVIGTSPTKKGTSFLPHTVEEKARIAAANVSKFVKGLMD